MYAVQSHILLVRRKTKECFVLKKILPQATYMGTAQTWSIYYAIKDVLSP